MKNKSTTFKTVKSFVIIFALVFSTNTYAYSGFFGGNFWNWLEDIFHTHYRGCGHDGGSQGGGHQGGGDSVPLDGGLGILVLGAAAFGAKKLRDNKNDKA
jgi:hypothetical protein